MKNKIEKITVQDFTEKQYQINSSDQHGNKITYVLLTNNSIASIREGKGEDVERATIIAGSDQSKYFSALIAATVEIDEQKIVMEDLASLKMKDYMRVQVAFSELNF